MANAEVNFDLYSAVLNRMNITWDVDPKTAENIRSAIDEAMDYLRSHAGNPALTFERGELRQLLITCAWYFVENQRAAFYAEYKSELLTLRMMEGFGCGKEAGEV